MKLEKRNLKRHLFICCNEKEEKDCCASKNPNLLIKNLKRRLKDNFLWSDIKVTRSGCLGPCSQGITAVLYPDNILLTQLELSDEDELYDFLIK